MSEKLSSFQTKFNFNSNNKLKVVLIRAVLSVHSTSCSPGMRFECLVGFDILLAEFISPCFKRCCTQLFRFSTSDAVIAEHPLFVGIKVQPFLSSPLLLVFQHSLASSLPVLFVRFTSSIIFFSFFCFVFCFVFAVVQMLLSQIFISQQNLNSAGSADFQS